MFQRAQYRRFAPPAARLSLLALVALLALPLPARAGKLSWLDEVVQEVVLEAKAGGRAAAHGEGSTARAALPTRPDTYVAKDHRTTLLLRGEGGI